MKQKLNSTSSHEKHALAFRRIALGACAAIALMTIFISSVESPNPEWGKYWYVRPIIVIVFAGATGGAYYHLVAASRYKGWRRILLLFSCVIVYIIGLWLGSVVGLDGTLWN